MTLRALTVRQPWAWAIIHGHKTVENRPRPIHSHRGPLAIHAGLNWETDATTDPALREAWDRYATSTLGKSSIEIRFGAVIGVVDLVGCHFHGDPEVPCDAAGATLPCTPWSQPNRWHLELANPRRIVPVPARGALSLWRLPEDVDAAVRAQLTERAA